ncbi:MAG TPA: AAA family ATPase [Bryobacteraceae bacterium]|nr:AAA family ATPase [Bryobacteraceae bacterium]
MANTLDNITNRSELERLLEAMTSGKSRSINAEDMMAALNDRVKGQEHVTQDVVRFIRQEWAKEKRDKPIASFLFVGPTGTGKTELAKAMTAYLYKDEKAMLRFDGSELDSAAAKWRLVGAQPGHVSVDQGGQLTRPMFSNPRRLILFDEIEKACTEILDLFLQIMGDGRLTEQGSGRTADFTQSIIILTSNQSAEAITKLQEQVTNPIELTAAVKAELVASGRFRPEIAGRIDKICVFKPLSGIVVCDIIAQKMANSAKAYGLELKYIDPRLIMKAYETGQTLKDFGMRELERQIGLMLNEHFIAAKEAGFKRVRVDQDDDGEMAITCED